MTDIDSLMQSLGALLKAQAAEIETLQRNVYELEMALLYEDRPAKARAPIVRILKDPSVSLEENLRLVLKEHHGKRLPVGNLQKVSGIARSSFWRVLREMEAAGEIRRVDKTYELVNP